MGLALIISVLVLLAVGALIFLRRPAVAAGGSRPGELEARRFAKLLIAEVKLNNGGQVEAGRRNKDLYLRLGEEIERARRTYDGRVGRSVGEGADYFHDELVRELAGGDASALGSSYRRN